MIGYFFFLQALGNALPGRQVVSLICQAEVTVNDPAFANPTKFIGPIYSATESRRLAGLRWWRRHPGHARDRWSAQRDRRGHRQGPRRFDAGPGASRR